MSWTVSVFRGDPEDLDDEERLAALDLERALRVFRAEGDAEDAGRQILIGREAAFTDVAIVVDEAGVLRALESEIHWDDATPAAVRAEVGRLLDLFFRLGDELGARVFDHHTRAFVRRADAERLLDRYVG